MLSRPSHDRRRKLKPDGWERKVRNRFHAASPSASFTSLVRGLTSRRKVTGTKDRRRRAASLLRCTRNAMGQDVTSHSPAYDAQINDWGVPGHNEFRELVRSNCRIQAHSHARSDAPALGPFQTSTLILLRGEWSSQSVFSPAWIV